MDAAPAVDPAPIRRAVGGTGLALPLNLALPVRGKAFGVQGWGEVTERAMALWDARDRKGAAASLPTSSSTPSCWQATPPT